MATLGTDTLDGYLTNYPIWVAMDGAGRVYVTLQPPGDLVLAFDSLGKFLGRIGKKGQGPGEFAFPVLVLPRPDRSLLIYDFNGSKLSTLTSEWKFVGMWRQTAAPLGVLADGRMVVNNPAIDRELVGYPLHLVDTTGKTVASFGADSGRFEEADRWRLTRTVSVGPRGTIWSAYFDRYRIEEWSPQLDRIRILHRTVQWMPVVTSRASGVFGERPTAQIVALREDSANRLWVFSRVPSENWRAALGPPRNASRGRTAFPERNEGLLFDTEIDVIDLKTDQLLVSQRVREHIRFSLDERHAASYREDDKGTPLLVLWRVSLVGVQR
jgi:6-bladed beta-propeller